MKKLTSDDINLREVYWDDTRELMAAAMNFANSAKSHGKKTMNHSRVGYEVIVAAEAWRKWL